MTIKQKQCLLCYLSLYSGAIDGSWGPQSVEGTKAFQRKYDLTVDGVFGPETEKQILSVISGDENSGDWWGDIRYFRPEEFKCKCGTYCDGYPARMQETLVRTADRVRANFDAPVTVSSGVRCTKHNANVGGVANSRHLSGKAMDFCVAGKTAKQVLAYVQTQPEIRYAYAIDERFVHMDIA